MVSAGHQPKHATKRLPSLPEGFASLLDAIPEAVVIQAAGGAIVLTNRRAETLFACSRDELRGQAAESLIWEDSRQRYRDACAAALATASPTDQAQAVELRGVDAQGHEFPIELTLAVCEQGGERYLVNTIRTVPSPSLRDRENEALLLATASLGAQGEPEDVLRTLVQQAAALLDAEQAQYAVRQGDRIVIRGRWTTSGWDNREYEPRKTGVLASVWESRRPFRSNDLLHDPRKLRSRMEERGFHSQLTVPLIAPGGQRLGAISLYNSHRNGGFSERDERILVAICQTGATILRRARDTERRLEAQRAVAHREREAQALLTVAERLNAAADPDDVRQRVVDIAAELLAVRRATMTVNRGEYAVCTQEWNEGVSTKRDERLPIQGSIAGWVISNAAPYTSAGAGGSIAASPSESGRGSGVLAVPIVSRPGSVVGVLSLFDRVTGEAFTQDDRRVAEGIAYHTSVALERTILVEQLRDRERTLHQQAVTDPLTGLPNRRLFLERTVQALARRERRGPGVGVLFLDLDGFKVVNDSLGHAAGDQLLQEVALRLLDGKRPNDVVARFGGDEFAVLLPDVPDTATALHVAQRLIRQLDRPFQPRTREHVRVNASAGVTFRKGPGDGETAEELLREADIALYQAKATAKGQAVVFEPVMSEQAMERLAMQVDLQRGLERGEFRLYYQPMVRVDTGLRAGMEALLRWQHPRRGLIAPNEFLSVMEESGLILPIGRWVLSEACRQAAAWQSLGPSMESLRVSVNLSARQLQHPDLVNQVETAVRQAGLDPETLELEVTESAVIQDPEAAAVTLAALRNLGVRVAIDNFGTGYSSLSYLQKLPLDTLKIDRSFLAGLKEQGAAAAIVQAAATMAHALGVDVTAEGIETEEQLSAIAKLGCDYAQGYLLSRPLPPDETGRALERWVADSAAQSGRLDRAAG